jgi:hypothetical protein
MPTILASLEAEIGRIMARDQPWSLNQQLSTGAHAYHPKLHKRVRSEGSQFQDSPGKKVSKTLPSTSTEKKVGVVACTCHPSYSRKHKIGESQSRPAWTKSKTLSAK